MTEPGPSARGEILPESVMKPDFDTGFGPCHQWSGLGPSPLLDEVNSLPGLAK